MAHTDIDMVGSTRAGDQSPHKRPVTLGVDVGINSGDPNVSAAGEAVAAVFGSSDQARRVVDDLVAAGTPRGSIFVADDTTAKRNFLKRYVHRDSDEHTHSNVASVFSALGGAVVVGLIGVLMASQLTRGGIWPIVAAVVGGMIGALIGSFVGGFALRPADDRSMSIVDQFAKEGTLVAVSGLPDGAGASLDEASRVLSRHNASAYRLGGHLTQADLHPGDTRSKVD